jgi:hypothetical protein
MSLYLSESCYAHSKSELFLQVGLLAKRAGAQDIGYIYVVQVLRTPEGSVPICLGKRILQSKVQVER